MAKHPKVKRGKVSAKSARSAGRSRDPMAGPGNTHDYGRYGTPQCDYVDGTDTFLHRRRTRKTPNGPAGSKYMVKIRIGERCQNEALVSRPGFHRCAQHLSK